MRRSPRDAGSRFPECLGAVLDDQMVYLVLGADDRSCAAQSPGWDADEIVSSVHGRLAASNHDSGSWIQVRSFDWISRMNGWKGERGKCLSGPEFSEAVPRQWTTRIFLQADLSRDS